MHWIDLSIFVIYLIVMLGIGYYFLQSNKDQEDYYVGGRSIGKWPVGLSVVATDVGGGFSIGLGGLGFAIGLSGSWMLFTGLVGAWLAAVFLIPKVSKMGRDFNLFTFPEVLNQLFNKKVALIAGIISAIGYIGFTSSQLLAGAKLASASFEGLSINLALIVMGLITVLYTVMGGLKAVIYTDTIQWSILLLGLIFIGIPMAYFAVGGMETIKEVVSPEMLTLTNLSWQDFVNWGVTIIPIWFIGMTLYQRIYACKNTKEAQKAWYIAGVFEYPFMAFMGVTLGLLGRVAADQGMFMHLGFGDPATMDVEMGLPLLLREILPIGLMGLMMSAYFSAILSTADSSLMAASGNVLSDVLKDIIPQGENVKRDLRISQITTFLIGVIAITISLQMENVLDLMLKSYAFMTSGLLIPLLMGLFTRLRSSTAAIAAMVLGGGCTIILTFFEEKLPYGLDANIYGITLSFIVYIILAKHFSKENVQEWL